MDIVESIKFVLENHETLYNEGAFTRWAIGTDYSSIPILRDQLHKDVKTEDDRKKLLLKIDGLINNSNRILSDSNFPRFLATVLVQVATLGWGALFRIIFKCFNVSDRRAFRDTMNHLREEVTSYKLPPVRAIVPPFNEDDV